MFSKTCLSLDVQTQCFDLLAELLDREFSALAEGDLYQVFLAEKSIHQILGSIRDKRWELAQALDGLDVEEFASELAAGQSEMVRCKVEDLAAAERVCSRRASRNALYVMRLGGTETGSDCFPRGVGPSDTVTCGGMQ